jgi:tellurite resistance protein TerA
MAQTIAKGGNAPISAGKLVVVATHTGPDCDLSALLLTAAGKVRTDADFVFYGQPRSQEGSVNHVSKTPNGSKFTHELTIDLACVPADVDRVALTLTIDPSTPATFSAQKDVSVAFFDDKAGARTELVNIAPTGDKENAFIVADVYRKNGQWKVRHVAQGFVNGLAGIATAFGVDISDDGSKGSAASSTAASVTPNPVPPPPPPAAPKINLTKPAPTGKLSLTKGNKISIAKTRKIVATGGWDNTWKKTLDYDLFAHVAYRDGRREIVNFDNLVSKNGKVRHMGDLLSGGSGAKEVIEVEMSDDIACVGFSFYSARENGAGSFAHAKARVSIDNGEGSTITIGVSQMSVDSNRYTLYFGTIINGKGDAAEAVEIIAAEDYSARDSERQAVLNADGSHKMDAGPENRYK